MTTCDVNDVKRLHYWDESLDYFILSSKRFDGPLM